jgi:ABC-type multidrug transport system ATPase subunit
VGDYLSLAARVRGEKEAAPHERLSVLGVAPLANRRIRDLTHEESRAVALVEALTSDARVLLLVDPLADLDPRAVGRVAPALAARVAAGATAVFSTASLMDARTLASGLLHFAGGKLTRRATSDEAWEPQVGPRGARLFIRSEGARYLLAELASDRTFQEVRGEGAELVVTGKDPVAMASAVAMASRRANVEIDVLTFQTLDGDA